MTVGWRSPLGGPRYDGPVGGERVRDDRRAERLERESTPSRRSGADTNAATDRKHATHGRLNRTTG
ncbi:hypothetical protein CV102_10065 [Natronococcus pandeyae]|uniref:Uncharacterized protein n=1 Tax=Natronococcus pandeyae TaxID=2055836 RepID=A0A8J8Q1U3_9EURY|nr:hypothetical protein CV102_10065 [Natronococcus pandeyae]